MKQIAIILLSIIFFKYSSTSFAQTMPNFYKQDYPQWFTDAKLGIFIHYGLYSVPAWSGKEQYAEWFYKGLISGDSARINFQKRVFGENFHYDNYKDLLKGELFNANEWAELFKSSGAKYVIFTSKHHDGFCMWGSKFAKNWNSVECAAKRDFCIELKEAVKNKNMKFGLYYSLLEWNNPLFRWTVDTFGIDQYVNEHLKPQFYELIDNFQPDLLFSDGDWDFSYQSLQSDSLVSHFYLRNKDGIVNNRWGVGFNYGYLTPEYSSGIKEYKRPWAECRGLSRSFGLNRNADLYSYMTSEELILHFVSLVAAGGGLTLNVAPSSDGQIPLLQQERLLDLGQWLQTNGEAIYGTKPYQIEEYHNFRMRTDGYCDSINFNWVRNSPLKDMPEDNFDIDFWGEVIPQYSEKYIIYLQANDTASLTIFDKNANNTQILQAYTSINSTLKTSIKLKKDHIYQFQIAYSEKDLDASVSLQWESKHITKETIKSNWNTRYYYDIPYLLFTQKDNNVYIIVNKKLLSLFYESKIYKMNMELKPFDIESKGAVVFKLENYLKN
ncbi:MAG: alpha-L-fucosidase [Bacteroidales bacterium]|jgi:alpha-L-fucosidase|nr:alpha-L-fucosidase [Bacteroidales bacterium]